AMVPQAFVTLQALPLSANGKVDRKALPEPEADTREAAAEQPPRSALERTLVGIWQRVLGRERVSAEASFFDLGGHSLRLAEVQNGIRQELGVELSMLELFQHPTVAALARLLRRRSGELEDEKTAAAALAAAAPAVQATAAGARADGAAAAAGVAEIAVVAMAGRFPGARDVEEFWSNLRAGVESIRAFSREEMRAAGVDEARFGRPDWVPAGGALSDVELFDASFFGFSPREAEMLDPQQRLLLECAWEALERAGYAPGAGDGGANGGRRPRVGIYAGATMSSYALRNLGSNAELVASVGSYQTMLGNDKDYLATRISYCLNLKGPSLSVQTACSTSLVAVALACQALSEGQCEMALAGGASVDAQQGAGYPYQPGHILSPDGHCRAFDARAAGTVAGSGVGVVALKPLAAALAAGDPVLAVIRGWAVNNDGARKLGYTAPSEEGQAEVIAAAQAAAGIDPATVGYVEAHGTGTALGDPIEVAGLRRAFAAGGGAALPAGSCALGSVKSNIGHLDAAAGVAGLIKTVLALAHREIPPSLHFESPNPQIDFGAGPFYVNTRLRQWEETRWPRRAGVSSFGIGGTNAHVVLEEAPAAAGAEDSVARRSRRLVLVSARTPAALEAVTDRLAESLAELAEAAERPDAETLADVAFTLAVGRRGFGWRRAVAAADLATARAVLLARDGQGLREGGEGAEPVRRPVCFLFPGQGSQYAGMGEELYGEEPVFRRELDRCAELLLGPLGVDLRQELFAAPVAELAAREHAVAKEHAEERLRQTWLTQPALFAVEYALARLWESWGVVAEGMVGHSVGEYVAATLAGVMELPAALALVAARGRLVGSLPGGAMLSVALGEAEARRRLGAESERRLWLAAVNGPGQVVVSG
ncbi:MAG TPA: beta-ketoacyl synthase N-terminal-like domain-containing protein, partial [Thermoanaerobaculia bacterium]|nr:beta-ketoacyl synthase N-terminal-like domain-containing protein [Thermoanaerobaculia bacterium]